ncbi:hypothetical protein, partial [Actinomadura rubrisoli]|uniref:hypothetical protein n=1 Tax=Actinomadura rubrisoli TaxID=2530368 RepID=UPI001A9CF930
MGPPAHQDLVADLHALRRRGPTRVRGLPLAALEAIVVLCGHDTAPVGGDLVESYRLAALEDVLRRAVGALGGGNLATAAEYVFGLAQGTRDWPIGERRKQAALVYGVSTERFRKHHERLIVEQTAEAMLRLCLRVGLQRQVDGEGHGLRPAGEV